MWLLFDLILYAIGIVLAAVLIWACQGCAHAPESPPTIFIVPGPAQPGVFDDCKPCRVPPTSDGERGWCA